MLIKTAKYCLDGKYLAFIFFLCPFSLISYLQDEFSSIWGRSDIFAILFFIVAVLLIRKKIISYLVPILIFGIFMTHIVSAIIFVPVIILLLLYDAIKKKGYLLFGISIIVSAACSIHTLFLSRYFLKYNTYNEILSHIPAHDFDKDGTAANIMIETRLLPSISNMLVVDKHSIFVIWPWIALSLLLILPVIILVALIWKSAYKKAAGKIQKIIIFLIAIVPIIDALFIIIFLDGGRLFSMAYIGQFMAVLFFVFGNEKAVVSALHERTGLFRDKPFMFLALCIYLLILGPVATGGLASVRTIIYTFI
jgi:hypothetical protein